MKYSRDARNDISGNKYNVKKFLFRFVILAPWISLPQEFCLVKEGSNTMCTATFCHRDFVQRLNRVQTIIPGLKWQLKGPEHRVPEQEPLQVPLSPASILSGTDFTEENPTACSGICSGFLQNR